MTSGSSELLELFGRYNQDLWPVHLLAYTAGVAAVALVFAHRRTWAQRTVVTILAALWLWLGVVFQGMYATDVSVALGFGYAALFVLQAYLLVRWGLLRGELVFRPRNGAAGVLGWVAIGYAIAVYPLLSIVLGHGWPNAPLLGMAPCPTTILTFGLFLLARGPVPHRLLVIPLLWAVLAPPAAMAQGALEDAGLLLFGVLATAVILLRDRSLRRAGVRSEADPDGRPVTVAGSARARP
jgi:hypothetical protein